MIIKKKKQALMDYGLKLDHILIYYKFKTLVQLT
jgi:hypothetical protein